MKSISDLNYKTPTLIQSKVIPLVLNTDKDVIALSQTGTGKTAAYGLPLLQGIDIELHTPQVLILSPTRELCMQISEDLIDYAKYISNIKIIPVYGGASIEQQIKSIKSGVHIIVATPGRLIDLMKRKVVKLSSISTLILDEADEMLNMGFSESINTILDTLPNNRKNLLFSATMPNEIINIARKYMNNPVEITVGNKNSASANVKHIYYTVNHKDKYLALKRLLDYYIDIYGIIFCRTKLDTQHLADELTKDGFNAEPLHGDLSQAQRDVVMKKFRNGSVNLLVATDIAARGIDVDDLTHIIHYSLPDENDAYNHRSGRTGRAGKRGLSIAITNPKEIFKIRQIEKRLGIEISSEKVPTGDMVCENKLLNFVNKIENIEDNNNDIIPYLTALYGKLSYLSKDEIIKRLLSSEFNQILKYYENAIDLNENIDSYNPKSSMVNKSKNKSVNGENSDFVTLYINLGKSDGFYAAELISRLNMANKRLKFRIGEIDIYKSYTLFGIDKDNYNKIINSLNKLYFEDKKLVVKVDNTPTLDKSISKARSKRSRR